MITGASDTDSAIQLPGLVSPLSPDWNEYQLLRPTTYARLTLLSLTVVQSEELTMNQIPELRGYPVDLEVARSTLVAREAKRARRRARRGGLPCQNPLSGRGVSTDQAGERQP